MYWQKEYLREDIAMTLPGTYKLELPDNGLLGSILLRLSGSEVSGYGQGGGAWRIIDQISKLEVLLNAVPNGKSITGYQAQALAFFDQGITSPDAWRNYATNTQWAYILLNFGRKLYDKDMGLNLAKWNTVELHLTNEASSSTEFSDLTVSVLAYWLRDVVESQFKGYMRSKEWYSHTTVRNEWEYLKIPTEAIMRRILLQAIPAVDASYVEKTGMHNLMDDIELAFKTGALRAYRGGLDDLMRDSLLDYGREVITGGFPYMTADKGIDVSIGYVLQAVAGAGSHDGAGAAVIPTIEAARTSFTQKPETYEADNPMTLIARGMAYHNCVPIRFDQEADPATWLDTEKMKTVKLDIHTRDHADAVGGANKIVLDEFIKY